MTQASATPGSVMQLIGSFGGGGAQRLALNLAEAIAERGVRSIAVAMRDAGGFAQSGLAEGVELRELGLSAHGRGSAIKAVMRLRSLIVEMRPDVLHVHGSSCLIAAALARRLLRRPPRLVFTWHDSGSVVSKRLVRRLPTVWSLNQCDDLLGSSRDVARRLDEAIGQSGRSVAFLNGVPETSETARASDATARLVWAGRLVPQKDPEALLRAMAWIRDAGHNAQATIAGGSLPRHAAYEQSVLSLHQALDLSETVSMPGWVDDPGSLYLDANIGVQTSHTEGLSMSLLEMMMAGLCVIATDVGDSAVAIEDGQTGIIIPPRDQNALQSALHSVIADPEKRARLGRAARARAIQVLSTSAMADRALGVYRGDSIREAAA